jgi:hypothetical protein
MLVGSYYRVISTKVSIDSVGDILYYVIKGGETMTDKQYTVHRIGQTGKLFLELPDGNIEDIRQATPDETLKLLKRLCAEPVKLTALPA